MRTKPTLEAFEAELRKYNALEQEIAAIPTVHNIGGRAPRAAAARSHVLSPVAGACRRVAALGAALHELADAKSTIDVCAPSPRAQAPCPWRRRR